MRPFLGMVFWVQTGKPKPPPDDVIDSDGSAQRIPEKERLFYRANLYLQVVGGEPALLMMPWKFIELIGRGPEDFADTVPIEHWDTYTKAYLKEKAEKEQRDAAERTASKDRAGMVRRS